MQRLPAITHDRFGLFRFRSPLLTESRLFSLPVGTEMFHFPTFPLPALYIQAGVTGSYYYAQRGFPIRKSSDQSSIISSPRLIADLYVLLRLQMPRHPPSALRNLISHEYESIARPRRIWRSTNGDRINPISHCFCDTRREQRNHESCNAFDGISKMLASTV